MLFNLLVNVYCVLCNSLTQVFKSLWPPLEEINFGHQGFIQDFTLGGGHFLEIVNVCETEVVQITPF